MSKRGLVLFATLGLLWGLPYLLIKWAVTEVDPVLVVFWRTFPAAVMLLAYSAARGKLRHNLRYWKPALLFAFVELVFPWWMVTEAETMISSSLTGLLLATVPLFGVVIARLRGDEHATNPRRMFGLLVGVVGVVVLLGLDPAKLNVTPLPVLYMMLSALGYALGPVVVSNTPKDADSATMIGMSMAVLSILYLPLLPSHPWPAVVSATAIWSIVGLCLICSVAAFLVFFALIEEVGPINSTLVTYVNPAVALALGIVFLQEPLTLGLIAGFPLVLAGSYLASR